MFVDDGESRGRAIPLKGKSDIERKKEESFGQHWDLLLIREPECEMPLPTDPGHLNLEIQDMLSIHKRLLHSHTYRKESKTLTFYCIYLS